MSAGLVVAATRRARRDLEGAELTCPLTTPRPARAFAGADTPAFIEACNKLGWSPWPGGRPADECYPLTVLQPLPDGADGPATLAIDMRDHLGDEAPVRTEDTSEVTA